MVAPAGKAVKARSTTKLKFVVKLDGGSIIPCDGLKALKLILSLFAANGGTVGVSVVSSSSSVKGGV